MNRSLFPILFLAPFTTLPLACSTAPEPMDSKSEPGSKAASQHKAGEVIGAAAALKQFLDADPTLQTLLDSTAGYAILPDITKAGAVLGAAFGKGEVYERGTRIGTCELSQGTVGAQLGGDAYSELIIFHDQKALGGFKKGEVTFAANATAVAIKPGAASIADRAQGTSVFIHLKGGLMLEAAIGGEKITFKPL